MLTPAFELQQDENFLTITIRAPFTKVSETEILVDGAEFKFYSKPYYLRLNLPGRIVEDGHESAKYDTDLGTFTLVFPKETPGENFDRLDMLTQLLAPSGGRSAQQPRIEVLDDSANQHTDNELSEEEEEEFDWQIEQLPFTDTTQVQLETPCYGFANQRSGVFKRLQTELHDMIDLCDADSVPNTDRRSQRLADELQHFDDQYYLSDAYENDTIPELLSYEPPWVDEYKQISGGAQADDIVQFTEDEKEQMRKLPRKEYILERQNTRHVLLGLVDLIFSYCYNHRTNEGENNVESGWTIAKLSATLSWLETYSSVKDVSVTCCRRSLCFPLYRHWLLTQKLLKDTHKILTIGRRRILKCLLEIQGLLQENDSRYILNDLYITDYCVWIQSVRVKQLESLARNLKKIKITKADVELDIELLERAAQLAIQEQQHDSQVLESVTDLSLQENDQSDLSEHLQSLSLSGDGSQAGVGGHTNTDELTVEHCDRDICKQSNMCAPRTNSSCDNDSSINNDHDTDDETDTESSDSEYTTDSRDTHSDGTHSDHTHSDDTDSDDSDPDDSVSHDSDVSAEKTNDIQCKTDNLCNENRNDTLCSPCAISQNPVHTNEDNTSLNF